MAELTCEQIFDGITRTLKKAYPESHIYGKAVKQGLKNGDFIVLPITTNYMARLGSRAEKSTVFEVIYFPSEEETRTECLRRADELGRLFETVSTPNGDSVHCLSFNFDIDDDVLHCTASFRYFTAVIVGKNGMTAMKQEGTNVR